MRTKTSIISLISLLLLLTACQQQASKKEGPEIKEYLAAPTVTPSHSQYANDDIPRNLYWGDTHLHTNLSPDANLQGNTKLGPADAFRLAMGKKVTAHNGMAVQLYRPLDFLVVTDHAEYLGLLPGITEGNELLLGTEYGANLAAKLRGTQQDRTEAFIDILTDIGAAKPKFKSDEFTRSVWQYATAAADKYNDPGRFSAFIGYEWTSMPKGNNLHRIVMFKDDASYANQILPFSAFNSENPEDLWNFLADYERNTKGNVLAIAHNGNISNGTMFMHVDFEGKPLMIE